MVSHRSRIEVLVVFKGGDGDVVEVKELGFVDTVVSHRSRIEVLVVFKGGDIDVVVFSE